MSGSGSGGGGGSGIVSVCVCVCMSAPPPGEGGGGGGGGYTVDSGLVASGKGPQGSYPYGSVIGCLTPVTLPCLEIFRVLLLPLTSRYRSRHRRQHTDCFRMQLSSTTCFLPRVAGQSCARPQLMIQSTIRNSQSTRADWTYLSFRQGCVSFPPHGSQGGMRFSSDVCFVASCRSTASGLGHVAVPSAMVGAAVHKDTQSFLLLLPSPTLCVPYRIGAEARRIFCFDRIVGQSLRTFVLLRLFCSAGFASRSPRQLPHEQQPAGTHSIGYSSVDLDRSAWRRPSKPVVGALGTSDSGPRELQGVAASHQR